MASDNNFWFLALQPVMLLGKICPVDVKNLDKISGIKYKVLGLIPVVSNGSAICLFLA